MNHPRICLFTDEDVDARLAVQLGRRGYDVLSCVAAGRAHQGVTDEAQLEFAVAQQRAILTHNIADFAKLASDWSRRGREHCGIIVVEQRPIGELVQRTANYLDAVPPAVQHNVLRFLP